MAHPEVYRSGIRISARGFYLQMVTTDVFNVFTIIQRIAIILQFDDPNGTISNILDALRSKDIPVTFAPNKLKIGAGEQCLYVLDKLADLALIANQFSWIK